MTSFFFGNSLWQLVKASDTVTWCILILLMLVSVTCWLIFFYKLILIRIKQRHMAVALEKLAMVTTLQELLAINTLLAGTTPGYFIATNLQFLKTLLDRQKDLGYEGLSATQWELVQDKMHQIFDAMLANEAAYLPVLSTTAAVAPLLGLFGTVWGLVHSFIRIAEMQSADIATVAPGIAEALVTTLAGLVVAIPALILFNTIRSRINAFEQQLLQIIDALTLVMHQSMNRQERTHHAQKDFTQTPASH